MIPAFIARCLQGSGRGQALGFPTVNLDLADVPENLNEGVYACWVTLNDGRVMGALHYGPRPVFNDAPSCEVHLLNAVLTDRPDTITVEPVSRLRDVRDFGSVSELQKQIERDIACVRAMLGT